MTRNINLQSLISNLQFSSVLSVPLWLIVTGIFFLSSNSLAQELSVQKCIICHGKRDIKRVDGSGKVIPLYVNEKELSESIHAKWTCTDCHADVVDIPHKEKETPKRVNCTRCHFAGNPVGAPQTVDYEAYKRSIHGVKASQGDPRAPVCQDCHGTHNIRPHTDPASKISRKNIAATCGSCHMDVYAQYVESIHGEAVLQKGSIDAPVCTNCHGEHEILSPRDEKSKVYVTHVPKACSECHGAETIMSKYGIVTEQVATFEESFHGIAGKFGEKRVANCASCHGVHDIRAPNDPRSSVYIDNIPKTCGKCHPGANINYAMGKIHVDPTKREAGVIFYVAQFFKYLTILTLCGLAVHIILDFNRKTKKMRERAKEA